MEKKILSPRECEELIPHWPELNDVKINRLLRMKTRKSSFDKKTEVMSPVGIVILNDGYILNGKHRAAIAVHRNYNLEAYVVESEHDVLQHLPHKTYGDSEMGLALLSGMYSLEKLTERERKAAGLLAALRLRDKMIAENSRRNIRIISDLVNNYPWEKQ